MKPDEIETLSFKIIEDEAGDHGFPPDQWPIVRRMVHTSADFEYIDSVRFHPEAIARGIEAMRQGKAIVTDTNMAKAGIRKTDLERFGVSVNCYITDPVVREVALEKGSTRAEAAVDVAGSELNGGIYAVGNAPTALLRLIELIRKKSIDPALVVGFPVGFVNAAESKAELMKTDCAYISNTGRKGGSNIAASVINALTLMAMQ
jgi:precorrin-8X/cobalt-precorrin-8 methylmutase